MVLIVYVKFIDFLFSIGGVVKSPSYHRKKSRENYHLNKEISKRYHGIESRPGESFTQFKKRVCKKIGSKLS